MLNEGLPALGWEMHKDFGGKQGLGRGENSVEYNAIEATFQHGHFL